MTISRKNCWFTFGICSITTAVPLRAGAQEEFQVVSVWNVEKLTISVFTIGNIM